MEIPIMYFNVTTYRICDGLSYKKYVYKNLLQR